MKIKSLQLKNFKRFTDLTLQGIPDNAKLVLLIGSNGSGKSCVFDAFELLSGKSQTPANITVNPNVFKIDGSSSYHRKNSGLTSELTLQFFDEDKAVNCNSTALDNLWKYSGEKKPGLFYGRSSNRYIPRITKTSIGQTISIEDDEDRPKYYIDFDNRFENDIDILIQEVVEKIFTGINTNNKNGIDEIKFFLDKINVSFPKIFGTHNGTTLAFKSFVPPAEGKPSRLIFQKGNSLIDYDLLSAGEKEIVNLLFNLFVRREYYKDTIYFFDEIDLHLNTRLQLTFLKEITENWIPANCQLWTASHSLGFIQYAKESKRAVIFDFDDYDFDYPRVLTPVAKDNPEVYEIAVNKEILPLLFKNYKIFFVENKDRLVYSELNIANTLFVQENGKTGVYHKVKNGEFSGIVDRDFTTDGDIDVIEKQYNTLKVLRYYSIENYLFHPDNLMEHYTGAQTNFDITGYTIKLLEEKNKVVDELIRKLALVRISYPFFKEPEFQNTINQKRFANSAENLVEVAKIEKLLKSDVFEDFYKVFPMKDYATQLSERQNLSKIELAKTNWFKSQIESIIK